MHKKDRWTLHRRLDSIQGIFTLCITNIYRSKTIYTISYVSKTYYQYTMLWPKRHNREILSIFPKNFLFRLIIVCFPRGIRPTATVEYGCNKLHDAVGINDVPWGIDHDRYTYSKPATSSCLQEWCKYKLGSQSHNPAVLCIRQKISFLRRVTLYAILIRIDMTCNTIWWHLAAMNRTP